MPSKNLSAIELRVPESKNSNIKISSEFRKILKHKLAKNSEKIFANLKKLGKGIFSKRDTLMLDDDTLIRGTIMSSRTNPDVEHDLSSHSHGNYGKFVIKFSLSKFKQIKSKEEGQIYKYKFNRIEVFR
jgi:hypothetical protein